jgi:hypothetical protein
MQRSPALPIRQIDVFTLLDKLLHVIDVVLSRSVMERRPSSTIKAPLSLWLWEISLFFLNMPRIIEPRLREIETVALIVVISP